MTFYTTKYEHGYGNGTLSAHFLIEHLHIPSAKIGEYKPLPPNVLSIMHYNIHLAYFEGYATAYQETYAGFIKKFPTNYQKYLNKNYIFSSLEEDIELVKTWPNIM